MPGVGGEASSSPSGDIHVAAAVPSVTLSTTAPSADHGPDHDEPEDPHATNAVLASIAGVVNAPKQVKATGGDVHVNISTPAVGETDVLSPGVSGDASLPSAEGSLSLPGGSGGTSSEHSSLYTSSVSLCWRAR